MSEYESSWEPEHGPSCSCCCGAAVEETTSWSEPEPTYVETTWETPEPEVEVTSVYIGDDAVDYVNEGAYVEPVQYVAPLVESAVSDHAAFGPATDAFAPVDPGTLLGPTVIGGDTLPAYTIVGDPGMVVGTPFDLGAAVGGTMSDSSVQMVDPTGAVVASSNVGFDQILGHQDVASSWPAPLPAVDSPTELFRDGYGGLAASHAPTLAHQAAASGVVGSITAANLGRVWSTPSIF